ncbi:MAG TPA: RNA polymerase factor sigma-54 [Acidobacteriota bacterium]|nr:RNA polymerase factor sigma-54 [Acidobacteriota bacterium]
MDMKYGLHQTQRQQLIITQRLQQALKLLQMPTLELQQALKAELMANPMLEEVDEIDDERETAEAKEEAGEAEPTPEVQEPAAKEKAEEQEVNWDDYWPDTFDGPTTPRTDDPDAEFYERVPVTVKSLGDHLAEQLRLGERTEEELAIGEYLIGSIDENGFLQTSVDEVAEAMGVAPERVEEVLALVQTFDPPGVGARNLQECLWLQLVQRKEQDSLSGRIVQDQFDHFVNRRFGEIARHFKVTVEAVQAAGDLIATLDPRPGQAIAVEETRYVVPDLVVERVGEDYVVTLNDRNVPRLRISSAYAGAMRKDSGNEEARAFIKDKLSAAKWLIGTIEQRRKTMVKVMRRIVEEQRDFFDRGVEGLKPLTLQQIANHIGMHESTVSRVTTQKYVQTPRGVFELKYFFSSGLHTEDGDDVSAKVAKEKILALVNDEDKRDPLSDQRIAELLKEQGLKIARRTVAKYREALRILPARSRRRYA